jgi:hypothetical protein
MMLERMWRDRCGQAAAEFGLALLILLPLIYGMLRFGELLHEKHKTIECARFAAWEKAYGRRDADIDNRIRSIMREASLFSPHADVNVRIVPRHESTEDDLRTLSLGFSGPFIGDKMPKELDLKSNNHYVYTVSVRDRLTLGMNITLRSHCSLIANPWHLTDRNGRNGVDNLDLEDAVYGIYMWPVFNNEIETILNLSRRFQDNGFVRTLVWLTGQSLDIDPRGHPDLGAVPRPGF